MAATISYTPLAAGCGTRDEVCVRMARGVTTSALLRVRRRKPMASSMAASRSITPCPASRWAASPTMTLETEAMRTLVSAVMGEALTVAQP